MIIVRLEGGLGNQLFQYATGRALAARHGTDLFIDASHLNSAQSNVTSRRYELDKFMIPVLPEQILNIKIPKLVKYFPKFSPLMMKYAIYREKSSEYDNEFTKLCDNTYLWGYWQSHLYFSDIAELLFNEIQPKMSISMQSKLVQEKMDSGCDSSVAIHVRRGDYVNSKSAAKFHGVLDLDYYANAINLVRRNFGNPIFFIFSDDIVWCKNHLPLQENEVTFVNHNLGEQSFQDLVLMSFCRHHIIANSSFSWWGAWLADQRWKSKQRIVVAPKRWFSEMANHTETKRFPNRWTVL